jgi:arylsulfatase A-like enzyme
VIVTADHGEEFLEHGRYGHGYSLYAESVRVPWVMQLPGAEHAGVVVQDAVGAVDLFPTVLDALGLELPALQGESRMPLIRAGGGAAGSRGDTDVFTSLVRFEPLRANTLQRGRWKLLRRAAEGVDRLYDLEADPTEQVDLSAREPLRTRELADALDAALALQRAARIEPLREPLSGEQLRQLEMLGYVEDEPR